jgi:hypothetical protein
MEKCRLSFYENWVMRRIFGPKRNEVKKGSGKDYVTKNCSICDPQQYSSGDQIKKNEMGRICSTFGGEKR